MTCMELQRAMLAWDVLVSLQSRSVAKDAGKQETVHRNSGSVHFVRMCICGRLSLSLLIDRFAGVRIGIVKSEDTLRGAEFPDAIIMANQRPVILNGRVPTVHFALSDVHLRE